MDLLKSISVAWARRPPKASCFLDYSMMGAFIQFCKNASIKQSSIIVRMPCKPSEMPQIIWLDSAVRRADRKFCKTMLLRELYCHSVIDQG